MSVDTAAGVEEPGRGAAAGAPRPSAAD
ncbi:MAG: hypothetical protein JWM27_1650, partial [Gemmatimonadetes bacterium]|nr:hypothetical protein [Gemmatimonadota bacterium]